jgi:hypothetical protein
VTADPTLPTRVTAAYWQNYYFLDEKLVVPGGGHLALDGVLQQSGVGSDAQVSIIRYLWKATVAAGQTRLRQRLDRWVAYGLIAGSCDAI